MVLERRVFEGGTTSEHCSETSIWDDSFRSTRRVLRVEGSGFAKLTRDQSPLRRSLEDDLDTKVPNWGADSVLQPRSMVSEVRRVRMKSTVS